MKKFKFLCVATMICFSAMAQSFSTHTIKQGETIGAIARKYNVSTSEMLQLNGLTEKTILKIGQVVKVPIKGKAKVKEAEEKKEVLKKETKPKKEVEEKREIVATNSSEKYQIQKGDNVDRIAKKHGMTKQQLMDLNNLKDDKIKAGAFLIVSTSTQKVETIVKAEPKKVEPKKEEVVKVEAPKKEEVKKIIKEEAKKVEVAKVETPKEEVKKVVTEAAKKIETKKEEIAKIEIPKPKVEEPKEEVVKNNNPIKEIENLPSTSNNTESNAGSFEGQFNGNSSTVEGSCGVFKTIAGWHDKKYYILLDNATSGSVVKVSANNKFVYAKVLGPLPESNADKKFRMRVSNATAAALGIKDNSSFSAKVDF